MNAIYLLLFRMGPPEAVVVDVDVFIPMMGTPNLFPAAKGSSGYFATMQSSQNIYPAMKGEQ